MTKTYTQEIPIAWHHVRDARKIVQEALGAHDKELRDAAVMTMSELVENAMKHGESVPRMPGATFTLTVDEDALRIEVANGIGSDESLSRLKACILAIAAAPDKEALYLERLREILESPSDGGRLGLFRIAFEGGFDLTCTNEDQVVTVSARRALR